MRPRPATATSAAATARARAYPVAEFIEKPPLDLARQFVDSGDYYWNSGMFVFKARRYLDELGALAPDILEAASAALRGGHARTSISCASTRPRSRNAAASPSTTRSWKRPAMRSCCRSMRAGATWVPGPRCSMRCRPTRTATCCSGDVLVHDTHDCYVHSTSRLVDRGRHGRSRHRRDQGRGPGGAQGARAGREGAGGQAQEVGPQRILAASRGVPALGQLRQHR